jgi:Na+-transporting methylmalonyl-CoA/oxaloacetate decarboxylase gamma subunit
VKLLVSMLMLILLVTAVSAEEETFHHFFGEVTGFDDTLITAQTVRQDYKTKIQDGKYGYNPAFKVTGEDGQKVRFFVGSALIKEVTLFHEGLTRVDLVAEDTDIVTIQNVPQRVQQRERKEINSEEENIGSSVLPPVSQRFNPSSIRKTIVMTVGVVFAVFFLLVIIITTFHKRAVLTKNAQILQYVNAQRKKGIEKTQITLQLQQSGWQREVVEEIMKYVK